MKNNDNALAEAVNALLCEKLSAAEVQSLKDEGFTLKKPTRKAAIAIAIYKKAASGDLSAIKELRSILGDGSPAQVTGKAVIIVDDIGDKNI